MSHHVGFWAAVTGLTVIGVVAVVLALSRQRKAQSLRLLTIGLIAALVGGCGMLTDVASLQDRIAAAGYQQVKVSHELTNGRDVLTVAALTPDGRATIDNIDEIARIVWETYPRTVDELNLTINGRSTGPISRDELTQAFGARDPELDKGTGIGRILLIALLVVLTILALIVVLVVVLVRRGRRARRDLAPPYPPYPPYRPGVSYRQVPPSGPTPPAPVPGQAQPPRGGE